MPHLVKIQPNLFLLVLIQAEPLLQVMASHHLPLDMALGPVVSPLGMGVGSPLGMQVEEGMQVEHPLDMRVGLPQVDLRAPLTCPPEWIQNSTLGSR